ncbi:MAG: hypothetical protein JWM88_261 [Verrucomicrobia bacterium]|nr:hypothetical protein [Verrucomicrobiota bacterium]
MIPPFFPSVAGPFFSHVFAVRAAGKSPWRLLGTGALLAGLFFPEILRADFTDPHPELLPPLALKRLSIEELLSQQVMSVSRKPENWAQAASDAGIGSLPVRREIAPSLQTELRLQF